jgi:para-nitrobenzyl esterase
VSEKLGSWRTRRFRLGMLVLLGSVAAVVLATLLAAIGGASTATQSESTRRGDDVQVGVMSTASPLPTSSPVYATTTHGKVKGLRVTADGYPVYQTYFGIRYGQSTAPPNRFLPPKEANWTGTFDATQFGPRSEQSPINGYGSYDPEKMNEDSLRVNIWTPKADNKKRPVFVYIHGGGYTLGRTDLPYYSGKRMAQKGIVFVTLQYRLGPFGFMNISEIPGLTPAEKAKYRFSGNLGLLDQRLALKFVHDNIAKFGGDPNRVTVSGGSAGAWSTTLHMALPKSNQYFQRAIAVSGSPQVGTKDWSTKVCQMTMDAKPAELATFNDLLTCDPMVLNDAEDVIYQQYDPNWWCILYRPSIDGAVITQDPKKSIRQGQGKKIALLTLSSKDELSDWNDWANWGGNLHPDWGMGTNLATIPDVCADVAAHPALTEAWPTDAPGQNSFGFVYERMVANAVAQSGKTPAEVEASYIESYGGSAACSAHQAFMYMLSDLTFRIPAIRMAENRLKSGAKNNTWMAVETFDTEKTVPAYVAGVAQNCDPHNYQAGAFHEVGLGFAFGIPEAWTKGPFVETGPWQAGHEGEAGYGTSHQVLTWASQLVPQHQQTWLAFIRTGNPNNPYVPKWAPYNTTTRRTLAFGNVPTVTNDWHPLDRELWSAVPGDPLYDCPTDVAIPLP